MPARLCSECALGHHPQCTGLSRDHHEDDSPYPCPCHRCRPPQPTRCTACNGHINPHTGECRCSD